MAIELEGLDGVLEVMDTLLSGEELKVAMGKACARVEDVARKKAKKGRTGDLRKFMDSKVEDNGGKILGIVFNPLEYAPYVEYGTGLFAENGNGRKDVPWGYEDEKTGETIWTKGQHPQPFLRPALNENREQITRLLREGLTGD